jgi:enterochelin esterase family protein
MSTLLERARTEGTPLIDGSNATFVWHGAGEVPQLIGDFSDWSDSPIDLTEIEPGVWAHTLSFPRDAYLEYIFRTRHDIEERFTDPFNPRVVYNGVESVNNYFGMPEYQPPELTRRKPGVTRGAISEHWLETGTFAATPHRKLYLYHPPVEEPVPLVVVWDGADYLQRGSLNAIVDNLIAEKRIPPIALALIDNGKHARFIEYMQNEASVGMLTRLVLPFASQHLNLIDASEQPGIHGVLGSSMGGLMALYAGLRAADLFGHVVCQSGAFWFEDPRYDMLAVNYVKNNPVLPLKIWQDVGRFEYLLDSNRQMHAILKSKGYDVTYREFNGGHNQAMWADNTWRALEAVYGADT